MGVSAVTDEDLGFFFRMFSFSEKAAPFLVGVEDRSDALDLDPIRRTHTNRGVPWKVKYPETVTFTFGVEMVRRALINGGQKFWQRPERPYIASTSHLERAIDWRLTSNLRQGCTCTRDRFGVKFDAPILY